MKAAASCDDQKSIRVRRFNSINEINEQFWDNINSNEDLFHTHRFIRSVEHSGIENSQFWYLVFYQDEIPVGTAVLCAFAVHLDLMIDRKLQKGIEIIKKVAHNFMKVNILFCGLPVSIGKHILAITDLSLKRQILEALVREMRTISFEKAIQFLCIKEFLQRDTDLIDHVTNFGFFRSVSLPYMKLKIHWKDFDSYLHQMRHGYRRHILRSLRKLGEYGPIIKRGTQEGYNVELILADSATCPPEEFYMLYLRVMDRAEKKLEILNQRFFEEIYRNLKGEVQILAIAKGKQILGTALLTTHRGVMTFMLVGLDYSNTGKYDVYFNLMSGIVALAIKDGCSILELGQTAYWVKQQVGAEPIETYFYLRHQNTYFNHILRFFRSFLFPKTKLQHPHVFRSAKAARN